MEQMRLDRFLANNGCGTRNEVKKLLRTGMVRCNGEVVKDPAMKISPDADRIVCRGEQVNSFAGRILMLNKRAGYITATSDRRMKTVMDLIGPEYAKDRNLFPVGRLDRDTEGLLLLMDDGELAHRLLSPSWHVEKEYEAVVAGTMGEEQVRAFADGLDIGDEERTLPTQLEVLWSGLAEEPERWNETQDKQTQTPWNEAEAGRLSAPREVTETAGNLLERWACLSAAENGRITDDDPEEGRRINDAPMKDRPEATFSCVRVRIREGRYHQIKRMFEAVGSRVLYLRRTAMGPVRLDESLAPGQVRLLREEEIQSLRACTETEASGNNDAARNS